MNFNVDKEEYQKLDEWLQTHDKTCKFGAPDAYLGAIGGRFSYQFTPTGIGVVTKILCACGEEVDVTNYKDW